jgi:histidine triad (HIT) family protein
MEEQKINAEQMKALQEKISQMTPEELKDFQKKQCIFCQIIAGKIQAKKIYEDEKVLALLDINPANPGHLLILTKEHYSIMPQVPDEDIAHIFMAVKSLSNSMLRGIEAQGTNIIVANGIAAGQRAQHFMAHIIPRKDNDGINFVLPQKAMEQKEIESIGNKLVAALGGAAEKEEEKPAIPFKMEDPKKKEEKKIISPCLSLRQGSA